MRFTKDAVRGKAKSYKPYGGGEKFKTVSYTNKEAKSKELNEEAASGEQEKMASKKAVAKTQDKNQPNTPPKATKTGKKKYNTTALRQALFLSQFKKGGKTAANPMKASMMSGKNQEVC